MDPLSGGRQRLAKVGRLAAACLTVLALLPEAVRAAPPTGDQIYYINQRGFLIPSKPEPGATGIQQVMLYVSDDLGRSYRFHASSGPTAENFKFTAPGDGWYWFTVQTKDAAGRLFPPNLYTVPPALKVCVDTLPPVVYLKQVATNEAAAAFEWDIREDNPDLLSLRADYRTAGDRDWLPLQVPPRLAGHFPWNPTGKGPWEVRMQIRDKAGNLGEQTATVAAGGVRPDTNPGPTATRVRANVVRVNSKQIQLNYKVDVVGKSDVSTVEIWKTEDDGRTWKLDVTNPRKEGPFIVTMPREGVFGYFVVPVSGVGLSEPPVSGTPPQVTVELDMTAPVVNLLGAPLVGTGADLNKVTIRYQATDKNLGPTPIRILWRDAKVPGSKWEEMASNLTNEGFYVWNVPDSVPAHLMFIKVEAVDLAGNVGSADTPVPVKVDPVKPRASITGVEAVKPAPPP